MSEPWDLSNYVNDKGNLIEHSSAGGYPILYIDTWGDVICPKCANKYKNCEDWENRPVYGEVYFEGPRLECSQCNRVIEPAYEDDGE